MISDCRNEQKEALFANDGRAWYTVLNVITFVSFFVLVSVGTACHL